MMGRPRKIVQFPIVGLKALLRWAFPKIRPERRELFYRYYLRDNLHDPFYQKATAEEIDTASREHLAKEFSENESHTIGFRMGQMIDQWQQEVYRSRASAGGKGKSKKAKNSP